MVQINHQRFCCQPQKVINQYYTTLKKYSIDKRSAISQTSKLWTSGQIIKFWQQPNPDNGLIVDGFNTWGSVANLTFIETDVISEADIRIGFDYSAGSWSFIGTDALLISESESTMNFGWSVQSDFATVLHEIGHSIGLLHEHQSPNRSLVFNESQVLNDLSAQGWTAQQVQSNIFDTANVDVSSGYDVPSIMHYSMPGSWILSPEPYSFTGTPLNSSLSQLDIDWAATAYPFNNVGGFLNLLEPKPINLETDQTLELDVSVALSGIYSFAIMGRGLRKISVWESTGVFVSGAVNENSSVAFVATDAILDSGVYYKFRVREISSENRDLVVFMWSGGL